MKSCFSTNKAKAFLVAPLVGAWIEILLATLTQRLQTKVAPLVGAWIEMIKTPVTAGSGIASHPSWVRGLKFYRFYIYKI